MAGALTQSDVTRLLAEPSPDVRAEIAGKVSVTLAGGDIAPEEIALAQDIVRILARDVEVRVRARVAQGLRHARTLPRDVALKLANDVDTVALPVLTDSLVLTEDGPAANHSRWFRHQAAGHRRSAGPDRGPVACADHRGRIASGGDTDGRTGRRGSRITAWITR